MQFDIKVQIIFYYRKLRISQDPLELQIQFITPLVSLLDVR